MEARLAPLAIARVIYGLRFGDFLTKAIHSQNLSRMSTLPVSDYWSWLGEASPTNPTNRVMTGASACILQLASCFGGVKNMQIRGIFVWLIMGFGFILL